MANLSTWRVNDVVAYDLMLDLAATLTALLLKAARSEGDEVDGARQELAETRQWVRAVDSYDRAAVELLTTRLGARVRDLSGGAS